MNCEDCKHAHLADGIECRRMPPQIVPIAGSNFAKPMFPLVEPEWRCGEWHERERHDGLLRPIACDCLVCCHKAWMHMPDGYAKPGKCSRLIEPINGKCRFFHDFSETIPDMIPNFVEIVAKIRAEEAKA